MFRSGSILLFLLVFMLGAITAQTSKPNIIFILADDLGYGDISCFNKNSKIKTPNIDRIAEAGLKFTDAHSASSVCTPTRYAFLTGRYAWRTELKSGVLGVYDAPLIERGRTTLASMLKQKGYNTAAFGKWHLGWKWSTIDGNPPVDKAEGTNLDFTKQLEGGPLDIGFDHFFGMDAPNLPPYTYLEDRKILGSPSVFYPKHPYRDCRPGTGVAGWNLENILPELEKRSVGYINEHANKGKPFFLYIPLTAPHTPIAPSGNFKGSSGLNVYADFVNEVDHFVGAILEALYTNKIDNNTILVFSADNGCSPEADFSFLASKGHYPSGPYRGFKADLFEGGHRVPTVLQWPAKVKPGIVDQTVSLNDFMASFATLVGYKLKNDEAEDSYNILPLFFNPSYKKVIRQATVHHSFNGDFAIRKGKWKLITVPGSGGWSFPNAKKDLENLPPMQLYNLDDDPAEKNNLFGDHPEIVKELEDILTRYKTEGRSIPIRR